MRERYFWGGVCGDGWGLWLHVFFFAWVVGSAVQTLWANRFSVINNSIANHGSKSAGDTNVCLWFKASCPSRRLPNCSRFAVKFPGSQRGTDSSQRVRSCAIFSKCRSSFQECLEWKLVFEMQKRAKISKSVWIVAKRRVNRLSSMRAECCRSFPL